MNWLSTLLDDVPDDPFYEPRKPLWLPPEMSVAPVLPPAGPPRRPRLRTALLINPFYAKSPHGSFGKHVLTPTLALTSIAGATPAHWQVRYWDENLLQGPPPIEPLPEVVGITVHLTFAKRAYDLARWYRSQGSRVILGGLHAQSCPQEVAPHADALAVGDGVQLWPEILRDVERFLLEFGSDFAFLARQKRMTIGGQDYYLDLLFYHRGLARPRRRQVGGGLRASPRPAGGGRRQAADQ